MSEPRENEHPARRSSFEIEGIACEVREAGNGRPVVVLGDDSHTKPLIERLAQDNRALMIESSKPRALRADQVAQIIARIGLERFNLIGVSSGATLALAVSALAGSRNEKLIVLAPPAMAEIDEQMRSNLGQITAPTLVMVGTLDRSGGAETMRALRSMIPSCQLLFVYGAGEDIAAERPDSCVSPIREFLDHGLAFVVCRESQTIRR